MRPKNVLIFLDGVVPVYGQDLLRLLNRLESQLHSQ